MAQNEAILGGIYFKDVFRVAIFLSTIVRVAIKKKFENPCRTELFYLTSTPKFGYNKHA